MKIKIYGVILCGGLSKRMGFDKTFIKTDDFLIKQIANKLISVFDDIYFVSNNKEKLYKIFDTHINVLEDIYKNIGPLGGIYTALMDLNERADYIFVCACDMPSINVNLINSMKQKLTNKPQVVICKHGNKIEPLFAFYHKSCLEIYREQILSGDYSIRGSFNRLDVCTFNIDHNIKQNNFENLNTLQDFLDWKNKYMSNLNNIKIYRYENNCFFETTDQIVEETQISIFINNKLYLKVLASNNNLESLAVGVLFSESVITTIDDIDSIFLDNDNIYVSIKNPNLTNKETVRTSGFGAGIISNELLLLNTEFHNNFFIKATKIIELMDDFNTHSKTFMATGAVHSCLIHLNHENIFAEDIGRHNALDKVIGYSLINKIKLTNAVLLTTGRISSEMLLKTAKSGINIIISRSAPTSKALDYAKRFNMTLIGFARNNRFNVYNGHEKIQS